MGTARRDHRQRALRAVLGLVFASLLGLGLVARGQAAAAPKAIARSGDPPAALLRAARVALDAGKSDPGERERGLHLLEQLSSAHPIIGDYADWLRADVLIEAGELSRAVAVLLDALSEHADSPLRARLYRELGDARLSFGDEQAARSSWHSALDATSSTQEKAELRLLLALSYERTGRTKDAIALYREVWFSHPGSVEARTAAEHLDGLEAAGAAAARTASDWRRRADVLFRAHHNATALEGYDRALALGLDKSEKRRALRQRAHTLFRMRRYVEAVESFAALPQSAESRLWHARSLARAGEVPRSIEHFEKLASEGHGEIGLRATYLSALLLDGRGHFDRARRSFERVAASRRYPGMAHGALWRLAWREYQDGDCASALPRLERLLEIEKDAIDALRFRYWSARCLERLGRPDAQAVFAEIASQFPFTYYGWRASFRTNGAPGASSQRSLPKGRTALRPSDTGRPRILIEAGLPDLARSELERVRRGARSLDERLEIAQLLSDAGDFNGAQRVVVDPYALQLAQGPVTKYEDLWWHAWPAAFDELVEGASERPGGVGRELVYSIMREESGYRPTVLSVSGAYGLMQIMPATGERLARDTGRARFRANDLLEPSINIGLGAHYLGQLSRRFPTRLSAAIASYNAGPAAVQEWIDLAPARDDDEWVEAIPYDQTRRYVKRVLRSLHVYRVLY